MAPKTKALSGFSRSWSVTLCSTACVTASARAMEKFGDLRRLSRGDFNDDQFALDFYRIQPTSGAVAVVYRAVC